MFHRLALPLIFFLIPRVGPPIFRFVRLIWRLNFDKRVPLVLRALVPFALIYALPGFPNLLKDSLHPVLGRFDDLIVLGFALLLLTKLAPQHVVDEHSGNARKDDRPQEKDPDKIVEGTSHIVDDE